MSRYDDRGGRDSGRDSGRERFGGGGGGGYGGGGDRGGGGRFGGGGGGGYGGGGGGFGGSMKGKQPGGSLRAKDWSREHLEPFEKNLYNPTDSSRNASAHQVEAFRVQQEITIVKDVARACPNPLERFEDGNFPDYVMSEIRKAGYSAPTPIQSQGWALALTGQDMVGIAQTGSGKTLGYLLPGIIHCNHQPYLKRGEGPIVLVLAPTR